MWELPPESVVAPDRDRVESSLRRSSDLFPGSLSAPDLSFLRHQAIPQELRGGRTTIVPRGPGYEFESPKE